MLDFCGKAVLTVIAAALVVIAWRGLSSPAEALSDCGTGRFNPCYVTGTVSIDGEVEIDGGLMGVPVRILP